MRTLFTLTLVIVLCGGVYLAGCDTAVTPSPSVIELPAETLPASKAVVKFDVCHKRDSQGYVLITVAEPAYQSHVDHGDGMIGDPVPDQTGFIFDATCTPVRANVNVCHLRSPANPLYNLITTDDPTYDEHVAHGDIYVGDLILFSPYYYYERHGCIVDEACICTCLTPQPDFSTCFPGGV